MYENLTELGGSWKWGITKSPWVSIPNSPNDLDDLGGTVKILLWTPLFRTLTSLKPPKKKQKPISYCNPALHLVPELVHSDMRLEPELPWLHGLVDWSRIFRCSWWCCQAMAVGHQGGFGDMKPDIPSQMLYVWYIYLHLGDFLGKCS